MGWKKIGQIYNPAEYGKIARGGYGANPVAVPLNDEIIRIFFNIRDDRNRAHITYLDYDLKKKIVLSFTGRRLVSYGEPGTFDDSGCSLGTVLDVGDRQYIYYIGWNLMKNVPWVNTIGMAVYDKVSDNCKKYSPAPILDRSIEDPLSVSYPFVRKSGEKYQMWYGSHLTWGNSTFERYDFNHVIKYAESDDGIHFRRSSRICIEGDGEKEYAFTRPSVLFENEIYKMWYAYRGEKYRIGYAESKDGIHFERKDDTIDLTPSGNGWESEEVSYPFVFLHQSRHYMLYCGNEYGKSGFGIAVEE